MGKNIHIWIPFVKELKGSWEKRQWSIMKSAEFSQMEKLREKGGILKANFLVLSLTSRSRVLILFLSFNFIPWFLLYYFSFYFLVFILFLRFFPGLFYFILFFFFFLPPRPFLAILAMDVLCPWSLGRCWQAVTGAGCDCCHSCRCCHLGMLLELSSPWLADSSASTASPFPSLNSHIPKFRLFFQTSVWF